MKSDISIKSIFSKAFQGYVNNWKLLTKIVLLFFPVFLINPFMKGASILTLLMSSNSYFAQPHYGIFLLTAVAFEVVHAVLLAAALDIVFKRPSRGIFFSKQFIYFFIAELLCGAIFCLGFMLLIIPGFYLMQSLRLAPLLVLEGKSEILDSLKVSSEMTKAHIWQLFKITFVAWAISFLVKLTIIGIFVLVPFMALLEAYLYKALLTKADSSENEPSTIVVEDN